LAATTTDHIVSLLNDSLQAYRHDSKLGNVWSRGYVAIRVTKTPDEPVTSSVPFVTDLTDALRNAHVRVRSAIKRVARSKRNIMMRNPGRPNFTKDNWYVAILAPAAHLAAFQKT